MSEVKIAIIGAGNMAHEHALVFSQLTECTLVGVYSRTQDRAQKFATTFKINVVANSIDELYHKTAADLVIVTVPELEANKIAHACFKYPWTVFLEKPAGYDYTDAKAILNAAKQAGREVVVGFNRRCYSSVRTILNELNAIENSRHIHIQDQQSFAEARHYNHPEQIVKKFMYANSIHTIDLIRVFARGEVTRITPLRPWQGEQTEVMLSYLEFESGDSALYEGIWKGPGPWSCRVSTVERQWTMQPLESARVQTLGERKQQVLELDQIDLKYKPGLYQQAQEVTKKVLGQPNNAVSLRQSFKTMELIHQMFEV